MTALTATRPAPSGLQQWWVLTTRLIAPTLRNGEVAVGVAVSVAVTASLYIPLHRLMDGPDLKMSSYAQYLMPLIALQAIAFVAQDGDAQAAASEIVNWHRALPGRLRVHYTPGNHYSILAGQNLERLLEQLHRELASLP